MIASFNGNGECDDNRDEKNYANYDFDDSAMNIQQS